MLDVVIVGGGISGLTLAWRALQAGLSFRLLESSDRLGGAIQSQLHQGGLQEMGPDALLISKAPVQELLEEMNLYAHTIDPFPATPWVARGGKLFPLPEGFRQVAPTRWMPFALTPLLSWWGKLRILSDLFLPASQSPDQTLAQLVGRRLGREVLNQLAQPLISGIYAADPHQLSLAATMPHLLQLEKDYGGLIRGLWKSKAAPPKVASLPGGLAQLVAELEQQVASSVCTGTAVTRIIPQELGWRVESHQQAWDCRNVVLATSAPQCAQLLGDFDPATCALIKGIVGRSVAVLNQMYFVEQLSPKLPACQGFLLPLSEATCFSAISLTHRKWPGRTHPGYINLRVHLGGAGREDFLEQEDATVIAQATRELRPWLDLQGEPISNLLTRHPQRMPEYRLGHTQRIEETLQRAAAWPGLHLIGNWLSGVGISECVARANSVAQKLTVEAVCTH